MTKLTSTLLASCLALAVATDLSATQAETGAVRGTVLAAGTEQTLSGALVRVRGTSIQTSTDNVGVFRLERMPTGSQTIEVSYLGYDPAAVEVAVASGETATLNVELYPTSTFYESVTVKERFLEGQARALNEQKSAVNIKNVVAADQIGRFPDPNTAEAFQRVPGVSIQRDQGEGRFVFVRGLDPRLTTTSINGFAVPAPEGDIRFVALDVIPADLMDSIEVTKSNTADMDGDSIGGALNLVTKQAPAGGMRFNMTAGLGYNEIVSDGLQVLNGSWGNRFNDDRASLVLSGSYHNTNRGSDNYEVSYDDGDLDELELRDYNVNRTRIGFNGDYQFDVTPNSRYFLRGIFNKFDDQEFRRRTRNRVGDDRMERELKDRFEEQTITSFAGGTTQRFANDLQLDLSASFGYAEENEPDRLDTTFRQDDVAFAPNISADFIDPDNIQANPLNEDINAYRFDEAVGESNKTTDRNFVLSADVTKFLGGASGSAGHWKAGAKYRYQRKDRDNEVTVFESEDDIFLSNHLDDGFDEGDFLGGRYVVGPHVSADAARGFLPGLEGEKDLEEDLADFEARENTIAGYGLVELNTGEKTHVQAGVRYEFIDVDYTSRQLVFDAEGDLASVTPTDGTNDYGFLLPMVHLRHEISSDANLRAAFTRTFSRPNFVDVVPFQLILQEDEEVELGNPDLRPTAAWNVDLLGEKYFTTVGVVSGGFFYKSLTDTIFLARGEQEIDGEIFDSIQPQNLDSASVLGFEAVYQNPLRFLPSPLDGLALFANYTYTNSSADIPGREGEDNVLPGQAENVGNFALFYEKYGFSARISWNYVDAYLLEVGDEAAEDLFVDTHLQLDLSLSQQLGDQWVIFADFINLTDEPLRVYEGTPERPIQEEFYSWWSTFGVKWNF